MNRTRIDLLPRLALRATTLLLVTAVAACGTGGGDAAKADSATTAVPAATSAPTTDVQPGNRTVAGGDTAAGAGGAAAASGATASTGAMLDPNSATRDQLAAVSGMTAPAADALVAGRPYKSMVDVDKALAKHLAADARKTVYAKVWKPINLNTASGDEILLIPGVGARMRHEFEEYRPYKSIEQFRREIGKYVDKNEVARLEQYVMVPSGA